MTGAARAVARWLPWEPVAAVVALLVIWGLAGRVAANPVLLPPPDLVLATLWTLLGGELVADILASLGHLSIGFIAGAATGLALAILVYLNRTVEILVDPLVEILRPISGIAWIPIAIAIFGIGPAVPIFLIFYVALFPIFLNTLAGIRAVDPRLIAAAQVLGAGRTHVTWRVVVPATMPMILGGVRLSLGVSWMTLIAAELIGGDSGLGWRAFWYEQFFSMHKTMAVIVTIGILGYILDAVVRGAQARLTSWSEAQARE